MMKIVLHPHQSVDKQAVYNGWNNCKADQRNGCLVASTGYGKSVVLSDIALDAAGMGLTQGILAHRNELVGQLSGHIANREIEHRIIGSDDTVARITRQHRAQYGRSYVHPKAPTAVIGVDTMVARADSLTTWANGVEQWILDEGHHLLKKNKWGKAVTMFPRARGLGVTATPRRADGNGLSRESHGLYDFMVGSTTTAWLIKNQFLSPYDIVCPTSDIHVNDNDLSSGGDYSPVKLARASKASHIVGDVVQNYIKFAMGRKAICFVTDVETAGNIANNFNAWGIPAAALSAKTNPAVREKWIEDFKAGRLLVLVNVDLFDEGFDVPSADVCIMARPTASLAKYLQMVGRVLRYVPGKVARIIDLVSNVARHGLPDDLREWSLDPKDKRGNGDKKTPIRYCLNPMCFKPYEAFRNTCPHCGTPKPPPAATSRSIEVVEGDLMLLDIETIRAMQASTVLEDPIDVQRRVGRGGIGSAMADKQVEKIAAQEALKKLLALYADEHKDSGLKYSEIQNKVYYDFGIDPLSMLSKNNSTADFTALRGKIETWLNQKYSNK